MKTFMKRMHGGQKGFTLIELLVVIAILGVIAAVVALNVAGFFGRGTLQAANTELHQAQTAIVACMAEAESSQLDGISATWSGGPEVFAWDASNTIQYFAKNYVYGPFRAAYDVSQNGSINDGNPIIENGWGDSITFDTTYMNWAVSP